MRRLAILPIAVLIALSASTQVRAQTYYRYAPAPSLCPTCVAQPSATQTQAPGQTGDPGSFQAWLNATRARYGLPGVAYDANLTAWAQQNNVAQQARGLGHWVMGPARRQNSAMSAYFSVVPGMWLASPGHAAALLDPSITRFGLAGLGQWWTFSAQ